jgi:hypothetical protein
MTQTELTTATKFNVRQKQFARSGLLPMIGLITLGSAFMIVALLQRNEWYALFGNVIVFMSGIVYVLAAKRYYRCPVCEKVVVPLGDDGKPSEVSFAIAYQPERCPYCSAALKLKSSV